MTEQFTSVVYLRFRLDWATTTEANYAARMVESEYEQHHGSLINAMQKQIRCWNQSCNVDFFAYRQLLKNIASINLMQVQDVKAFFQEFRRSVAMFQCQQAIKNFPEDVLVLFIDDDDWFAPDVIPTLKHYYRPDIDVYIWSTGRVFGNRITWADISEAPGIQTNNYAISKKLLNHFPFAKLVSHSQANSLLRRIRYCIIPEFLSLTIKTPASAIYQRNNLGDPSIHLSRGIRCPVEFSWAQPYLQRLEELQQLSTFSFSKIY